MAVCLTRQGRLDSLDILRGLDMVFLTVAALWIWQNYKKARRGR